MNPWLEEKVRAFHASHNEDELKKDYQKLYGFTKKLSWDEYLIWRALKDAVMADPFLARHRYGMHFTPDVKEWLYWNNIDRIVDLLQMTDEELRVITNEKKYYYKHITKYLSYHGYTLMHSAERTFKISSNSSLMAEYATRLDKWIISPPGSVHTFNLGRPTLYPEWFDEYYKRYELIEKEDKLCAKLIPVTAGKMYDDVSEYHEFFISTNTLWEAYNTIRDKYDIKPYFQTVTIPQSSKEMKSFPLDRFIEMKKEALRACISVFEQLSILFNSSLADYFEASDEGKLNITEEEKIEDLQFLMVQHVAMRIDFDNIIHYLEMSFTMREKPNNDWPYNPWLQETVMNYRNMYSEDELHGQYRDFTSVKRRRSWKEFLIDRALAKKIDDCPILLTATDDMELDSTIKTELKKNNIDNLAQLIQHTDFELNQLFNNNNFKREQISAYLEKLGLHLYHSEVFTCKENTQ